MGTNIEIKARVDDLDAMHRIAQSVSDTDRERLDQEDVFFHTAKGRLKLRILGPEHGELICYHRDDSAGPKRSDYAIYTTRDPRALRPLLEASLGTRGIVRKTRWLYLAGNARIHLDEVEGLGSFLEFEVVLGPEQTPEDGRAVAEDLIRRFGVRDEDLVEGAYIDLLEAHAVATE